MSEEQVSQYLGHVVYVTNPGLSRRRQISALDDGSITELDQLPDWIPRPPGGFAAFGQRYSPDQPREGHGKGGQWAKKLLEGDALWSSREGAVRQIGPSELDAAGRIWYSPRAVATNELLRLPPGTPTPPPRGLGSPRKPGEFAQDVAKLTGLINRSPAFTQPALAYRGQITGDHVFGDRIGSRVGQVFTDKGFVSVTASKGIARTYGEARIRVHIPAGAHALKASDALWKQAGNPPSYSVDTVQEYTLAPGSRFRVTSDEMIENSPDVPGPERVIDVDLLLPGQRSGTFVRATDLGGLPGGTRFAWADGEIEWESARFDPNQPREGHGLGGQWVKKPGSGGGLPWTVDGDVLSYTGSLGVPREETPQFSGNIGGVYRPPAEIIPQFVKYLQERGIKVTARRVPADSLKPIKASGSAKAIDGIATQLRSGALKDTKPIFVSSDGYVIDGTQTWAARRLADARGGRPDLEPGVPALQADVPAKQLLALAGDFTEKIGMPRRKAGEVADPKYLEPKGPPVPADSLAKYLRPDGTWEPARAELHRKIVDQILDHHKPQEHPVAVFLGGGPGSGKSGLEDSPDSPRINADEIKTMLPEYQQMHAAGDPRAANYVHEESSAISKMVLREAEARRVNITLDGVGDGDYAKMAMKVSEARSHGYAVHARYATVSVATALERARKRAELPGPDHGRMVPPSVVRELHAGVSRSYDQAVRHALFDQAEVYDNNGTGLRLIAQGTAAEPGVLDPAAYDAFIAKGKP